MVQWNIHLKHMFVILFWWLGSYTIVLTPSSSPNKKKIQIVLMYSRIKNKQQHKYEKISVDKLFYK
jgi:hypothetical protein